MSSEVDKIESSDDQKKTFREFFKTYNKISEVCFGNCVWDFGTHVIRNREDRCVMRCVQLFMNSTKEIGRVFADGQASIILDKERS